eukprot:Clim_evm70s157 gene=Clim_evmTU70s157
MVQMSTGTGALDGPLIKVPLEVVSRQERYCQKLIEKEMSNAENILKNSARTDSDKKEALKQAAHRLNLLKRKLNQTMDSNSQDLRKCQKRILYLKTCPTDGDSDSMAAVKWNTKRLNVYIVDYLLRQGYYQTAEKLSDSAEIDALVDMDLYKVSRQIEEALSKRVCTEALAWCVENRSKLRKIKSTLEFNIRVQEFVELIRADKRLDAIKYARKHLAPAADKNLAEVQQAMGLLAFPTSTRCRPYSELYDENRWQKLIEQFRIDNFNLHNMTNDSMLTITLQAGISALKTRMCMSGDDVNPDCPVCSPLIHELAADLPFSHRINSCLVCRISKTIMNEDNPPMALPNGNVYGYNALAEMAAKNDGMLVDPRSGERCELSEAQKVFIM